MIRQLHETHGIRVAVSTLKRFVQRNAHLEPVGPPFLPLPPRAVRRNVERAMDRVIRQEQQTPPPSPRRLCHRQSPPHSPPDSPPPQSPTVTPRTRRRAEVRLNRSPDSPANRPRRLPLPVRPPPMQCLRPRVTPRRLIAREPLDPAVDVTHRLEPFNARLFFFERC